MYEKDLTVLEGMKRDRYGEGIAGHTSPIIHKMYEPFTIAKIAIDMAARWGTVAGIPDGEDSSGRAKLRLQTGEELAQLACATAAALWKQFEERDWLFVNPVPVPLTKEETQEA